MRPPILTTDERRSGARRPLHTRATVLVAGRPAMQGRIFDISASGVGMVMDVDLGAVPACALLFRIALDNGVSFDARTNASVAYSLFSADLRGFKTGVRFASPPADLVKAVAAYVGNAPPGLDALKGA